MPTTIYPGFRANEPTTIGREIVTAADAAAVLAAIGTYDTATIDAAVDAAGLANASDVTGGVLVHTGDGSTLGELLAEEIGEEDGDLYLRGNSIVARMRYTNGSLYDRIKLDIKPVTGLPGRITFESSPGYIENIAGIESKSFTVTSSGNLQFSNTAVKIERTGTNDLRLSAFEDFLFVETHSGRQVAALRRSGSLAIGGSLEATVETSTSEATVCGLAPSWTESTHATRKGQVEEKVYDTAARTVSRSFANGTNGYKALKVLTTAPPDANLENGEVVFYTDGSGNLAIKLKDSGGTVRTGTVTLS